MDLGWRSANGVRGVLVGLLAVVLVGCGGGSGSPTSGTVGGTGTDAPIASISWGVGSAIPSLDIAHGFTSDAAGVQALALEGLVALTPDLRVRPALARSWSQPDPLHYVYELRPGVRFWDGSPLTAADVVYSLARHTDPKTASQLAGYYAAVASVQATGPAEVTVTLKRPDPFFAYVVAFSWIVPKALGERLGDKLGAPGSSVAIVGTGAYRITSFHADTGVELERNDGYWGAKPRVRRIGVRIIPDPRALRLAMEAGDIDGAFSVPVDDLRAWRRLDGVRLQFTAPVNIAYLSMDVEQAPFDDIHVRRAIAYALDGPGVARAFLGPAGAPATTLVPPAQWGDVLAPDRVRSLYASLPRYPFDIERARAELAQSGHPDGFEAHVQFANDHPALGKALVSLSQSLKRIGIRLEVKGVPSSTWIAGIYAHDQALVAASLGPDYPDPANYLSLLLPSANATKNNFNSANFKDPEVDRLLARQAATTDRAERARLIGDVLRVTGEQLPYLPIWWQSAPTAVDDAYVLNDLSPLWYFGDWAAGLARRG